MMDDDSKICEVQSKSHLNCIMVGFYRPASCPYVKATTTLFSLESTRIVKVPISDISSNVEFSSKSN